MFLYRSRTISASRSSAIADLRAEVADLALAAAGKVVGESMTGDRQRRLVEEFLEQKTPEARAMKEIDKIEMVLQALAYEKEVEDPNSLVEFWESTAKYLKSDFAWGLFEELKRRSGITAPLPERPTR